MNFVFSMQALQEILERARGDSFFVSLAVPVNAEWDIVRNDAGQNACFIHRGDTADSSLIVVLDVPAVYGAVPLSSARKTVERIHGTALRGDVLPLRLPREWSPYHAGSRVAFFAAPRVVGAYRWIVEPRVGGSIDICFWTMTTSEDQINLSEFVPNMQELEAARVAWRTAFGAAQTVFRANSPSSEESLQASVDLDEMSFGAVTRHKTYTGWLDELTARQKRFVEAPTTNSIKLRGPSGSGKTLALELRTLRTLYAALDEGQDCRLLFATHSWAMTQQVEEALRSMDERGVAGKVDVYPLLTLAGVLMPTERTDTGFALLGEDSLSGKRLQLDRIRGLLETARRSDWVAFQAGASNAFRARVEAAAGSGVRDALVWDLMIEFACVISANGIMPGVNAERRYLALPRGPWMMPLATDDEKRFVILLYQRYVNQLKEEGYLTSDQVISDFLNYLETFAWNAKRRDQGYDVIFVDELHLFNEQERHVLHYLTRSADAYPRIYMALDPRQSPAAVYGLGGGQSRESGQADQELGTIEAHELRTIHRFTPEILTLVQHIHRSYPALELARDWELDADALTSSAAVGSSPSILVHGSAVLERSAVRTAAQDLARSMGRDERLAVVLVDPLLLESYVDEAGESDFVIIASRDDVDDLRYRRRAVVLSAAEYVAGLQFSHVFVAGLPRRDPSVANMGYSQRRLLSLLYLAVSRATHHVEIHVNEEAGGVPSVLESALSSGALVSR